MEIKATLSNEQETAWKAWKVAVEQKKLDEQRASMSPEAFELYTQGGKYPYSGAIASAMTWHITYTSIGTVVKCTYWGEELDLTDYGTW